MLNGEMHGPTLRQESGLRKHGAQLTNESDDGPGGARLVDGSDDVRGASAFHHRSSGEGRSAACIPAH